MAITLGNDIVDLTSPYVRGKGRNMRFVRKILTAREQLALSISNQPDIFFWQFWAAKESAFKALSRHYPLILSSPKHYEVIWKPSQQMGCVTGTVHTPEETLQAFCYTDKEKICCVCTSPLSNPLSVIAFGTFKLKSGTAPNYDQTTTEQSRIVRARAKDSISSYLGETTGNIDIRKPQDETGKSGPPDVWIKGEKTDITLSLSHDGQWVFFVWGKGSTGH